MNKTRMIIVTLLVTVSASVSAQYSQLGKPNEFMLKAELGYAPFTGNIGQAGDHGYYLSKYHQAAGANVIVGTNMSQDWFIGGGVGVNYYHNFQQRLAVSMFGANVFADIDFRPIWKGNMGLDYQPSTLKLAPMMGARVGGSILMGEAEPNGYGTTVTPLLEFYGGINWYYLHGLHNMEHNWHSFYATIGVAYMQQTLFLPVRIGWRW